jgi:hypothetical protein
VIGLGARLAVSGGRESIVRLVLTALGVAIGTTLLLLSAAADPAIRAHQRRVAWQFTGADQADLEGDGDPLLWALSDDVVDGREMVVLRVAATGPDAPVPPGLTHVPQPGEVHVSPSLAQLIDELPADRLADRFPSAPSGTVAHRYLAGPDDLVAVVGVAPEALEGVAGVRAVHHIRTRPATFQFTDFLRAVVGIGVVGLLMPVLVFVSTSTRLGAARREQRFAALRLAGATPRQTALAAAVEAGAAAAVGAALGAVGYLLLRPRVARIEIDGHPSFVSDVQVAPVVLGAILLAVPLLAVVAAMTSLRRLRISPLGVARRTGRPRPTARRLVPLLAGTAGFLVTLRAAAGSGSTRMLVPVMAAFALMIYGIVAAGPWLTVLTARTIGRTGRRASALLAGRRLEDDPAAGFRAVSGLVLAVFVASVFSGITPAVMAESRTGGRGLIEGATMAAGLPSGTSAAAASAALDAAVAAGAGRGLVLRQDPDPDRPLADAAAGRGPTALVACTDVDVLGITAPCPAGGTAWIDGENDDSTLEPAPYTAAQATSMPAETVVVETDGTAATTDRVRTAIQRAVPGAMPRLGSEAATEASSRLSQVSRMVNLALTVTLIIAGCGLAVAVAGGIIERKRPFALLRLSGMHLAELRRVALLEAAAPLLLIALASALLGLATSGVIVGLAGGGMPWRPPPVGYWLSLAGGLAVALGVAAATLPLLGRATAPSAVRFE